MPRFAMVLAVTLLVAWPATPAAGQATPPIGSDCAGAVPRQEVRELTAEQWARYIAAVRALQQRATPRTASAYDRLSLLHNRLAQSGRIHQTASFLPWHRLFLRSFEHALQQIDPGVSVPYWDWTRDSQRLANAPFWSGSLLGSNGRGARGVVADGSFADWVPFRGPFADSRGPRRLGLTRRWADDSGLERVAAAPAIARILRRSQSYERLRDGLEYGGHGDVHMAIGGDMADFFSPNDPVFWMHHAFIDKLWADWQARSPGNVLDYGGPSFEGRAGARLGDELDGFAGVAVRDVMRSSALCVTYAAATTPLPTATTLRTSSATIRPREKVLYIATMTSAARGDVDFEQSRGEGSPPRPLCRDVEPRFAVNTWTAVCETSAARLAGGPGPKTIVATYRGGAGELASSGSVRQRVVKESPKVLWAPDETVTYGTQLGENLDAFASVPGRLRFSVLDTAALPETGTVGGRPSVATGAPELPVTRTTVLDAGYHVLFARFTPRRGPPQLLTRSFVVTPGTLIVTPLNQRVTTRDPTPRLEFSIFGFVAGQTPASLTGFEQPICRAARPDGLAEDAPRPAGTYTIFCEGGSSLNYVFDTTATATLEVLEPGDPDAGTPPDGVPLPTGSGRGPLERKVCSTLRGRVYCGGIRKRRGVVRIVVSREGDVLARGRARRRGQLLELLTAKRLAPARYRLTLVTRSGKRRDVLIRILPPAQARRARTASLVCRLGTMTRAGSRVRDGVRVTRWRIVQQR